MRVVIAGAAVLCLVAAPPAMAAWQTSAPGAAKARAATVTAPATIVCTKSTGVVTWQPVQGVPTFDVWWSGKGNGEGNFNGPYRVSSPSYTVSGAAPLRVRVQSVAGTWRSVQVAEQICS